MTSQNNQQQSYTNILYNDTVQLLANKINSLDLQEVLYKACNVLTSKEFKVLVGRFNLDGQGMQTLESIGKSLHVTRERARQVQEGSLQKLARTVKSTEIYLVVQLAKEIIRLSGGILLEEELTAQILNATAKQGLIDGQIVKLALAVSEDIKPISRRNIINKAWYLSSYKEDDIFTICNIAHSILEGAENESPIKIDTIINKVSERMSKKFPTEFLISTLEIDARMKRIDDSYGLYIWRKIHPKSLADKIYIILNKMQRPLHFTEITNIINEERFDHKVANIAAVHNELIRNSKNENSEQAIFRLVGRGLYALASWGMAEGKVADVILLVLKEAGRPLSREEVVQRVRKLRDAKPNTIILNLQRMDEVVRPARGLYTYKGYQEEEIKFSVTPLNR